MTEMSPIERYGAIMLGMAVWCLGMFCVAAGIRFVILGVTGK